MQVVSLFRYPVKSMQGEALDAVRVDRRGLAFDRHWALQDAGSGLILTARREPALLLASGVWLDGGRVGVRLPDGVVTADDGRLSSWLGRDVALVEASDDRSGEYEIAVGADGRHDGAPDADGRGWDGPWARWRGPRGTFHDSTRTAVSIIAASSVGDWDMARFRPNIVVDGDDQVLRSAGSIRINDTRITVKKQIDRCVIVTRPQPAIERDVTVLRTINAKGGTLGVGALITEAGTIRIGDDVVFD